MGTAVVCHSGCGHCSWGGFHSSGHALCWTDVSGGRYLHKLHITWLAGNLRYNRDRSPCRTFTSRSIAASLLSSFLLRQAAAVGGQSGRGDDKREQMKREYAAPALAHSGTFLAHFWHIFGTFLAHFWHIFGTFLAHWQPGFEKTVGGFCFVLSTF